jgi:hypothetical protein
MDSIDVWVAAMPPTRRIRERWLSAWAWDRRLRRMRYRLYIELMVLYFRLGNVGFRLWAVQGHVWPQCRQCGGPMDPRGASLGRAICRECQMAGIHRFDVGVRP